jgi:hypothetical protein
MSRVIDAICWGGVCCTLDMYVVFQNKSNDWYAAKKFCLDSIRPINYVKPFELEDEIGVINGKYLFLYEIKLAVVPDKLDGYLRWCLVCASKNGADCCWFGFDGSFDFEHFLTKDIADQVYAICGNDGNPKIALDDDILLSGEWRETISKVRGDIALF